MPAYTGSNVIAYIDIGERRLFDSVEDIEDAGFHIGNLRYITYNVFRDKRERKVLGFRHPRGRTSGTFTVAGTIAFTQMHEHPLSRLRSTLHVRAGHDIHRLLNLYLIFIDIEGAYVSKMALYGVQFHTEGTRYDIEAPAPLPLTMQYTAFDFDPLTAIVP